ncbi:hypothetical protein ACWC4J_05940 [Streptomyces sp. NPDC001356]
MIALPRSFDSHRLHLLESGGQPVRHNWWHREEAARDEVRADEYGSRPGGRPIPPDEETAKSPATLPEQP